MWVIIRVNTEGRRRADSAVVGPEFGAAGGHRSGEVQGIGRLCDMACPQLSRKIEDWRLEGKFLETLAGEEFVKLAQ